jgi:hypothetical protein
MSSREAAAAQAKVGEFEMSTCSDEKIVGLRIDSETSDMTRVCVMVCDGV